MVLRGQQYPISEYALLFPDMDAGDYAGLVASIRELGLLEPIAVWRGQVIDGRHRCQACLEAGVDHRFVHLDDDSDPLAFILAKNRAPPPPGPQPTGIDCLRTVPGLPSRGRPEKRRLPAEHGPFGIFAEWSHPKAGRGNCCRSVSDWSATPPG